MLRGLITGFIFGVPASLAFQALRFLEVPLAPSNLLVELLYLFLARGVLETAVQRAAAGVAAKGRTGPEAARTAFAVSLGLALALAADPLLWGPWSERPHRALVFLALRPLVAAGWILPWASGSVDRHPLARAAWNGGLLAIVDRERGFATAVEVLFALDLLRQRLGEARSTFRSSVSVVSIAPNSSLET